MRDDGIIDSHVPPLSSYPSRSSPPANAAVADSIVLNAADAPLTSSLSGFYVFPVRSNSAGTANLGYDLDTKEIFYVSSSRRYKTDIQDVEASESAGVWDLRPVSYRPLDAAKDELKVYGFIAEEVAEVDPRLCFWSQDSEGLPQVEGVNYDQVIPLLLQETKELKVAREMDATHIEALKAAAKELKAAREMDATHIEALKTAAKELKAAREMDAIRIQALEDKLKNWS